MNYHKNARFTIERSLALVSRTFSVTACRLGNQTDAVRTDMSSLRSRVVQLERNLKEAASNQKETQGRSDPQTSRELKTMRGERGGP